MSGCRTAVLIWVSTGEFGERSLEIKIPCGDFGSKGLVLCDRCQAKAEKQYPRGWVDIPGDVCPHGSYIGNMSTRDYLCGRCEDGN